MKITQLSESIWSLKIWLAIPIHVWVVVEKEGVTLVDAGIGTMAGGILRFLGQLEAGPLRRIVLTHGHSDHVGAIPKIRNRYRVPVFAHRIEIPYMEGDLPYPRRRKASESVAKGLALPLPDDGQGALLPLGGLTPFFTPGHSPGHVVYYHEKDSVLLAGDLFTSKNGKLRKPMAMFTADMAEAVRSAAVVELLRPARLEVCHGGPVANPAAQLAGYYQRSRVRE